MSSNNSFASCNKSPYYPKWLRRILIPMMVILPQGAVSMYHIIQYPNDAAWAVNNRKGLIAVLLIASWFVIIENFKCICLDEEHLWIWMILPRQPDEKRLNFKLGDMAKIREHFFPVVGRVIVIRNAEGQPLAILWISSWKNGRILEQLLAQAVRENGGQFINWKDGLLIFPRMVASWFRPPPEE